jgi:tRNA A37 threonylcarbamoyladenosine dehydratase
MDDIFVRTKKLIGDTAFSKLSNTTIILFGLGGVGGFILKSLARSGIENFILIDFDKIETSNLNRQIITNLNNISMGKADAAKSRVLSINKDCNIISINAKVVPNKLDNETDKITMANISSLIKDIDKSKIFIIDAIDDKNAKLEIIRFAKTNNIEIISCMGTARKMDSSKFKICDIFETKTCPLAKIMREMLRKEKIDSLTVLYSDDEPIIKEKGVIAYMPGIAGLMISEYVIKKIIN